MIERLLPAEVAGLRWDGGRHTRLHDDDLGADRHRLQRDGRGHLAGKAGILERVRVADVSPGTSSLPPKAWDLPVLKFVNDPVDAAHLSVQLVQCR
jgi:hypothetical protein